MTFEGLPTIVLMRVAVDAWPSRAIRIRAA